MKNFVLNAFLLFLSLISAQATAQEICDNAIDDDGDGLIDLNDDDCTCNSLLPSSLIPNPSFEEMTCCPTANAMLNCAVDWIQASAPTTDYVHTCGGYLGNTSIPAYAPLPFPDGNGGVGFRDGQAQAGNNYKEYVGACLTQPMETGVTYRLDFFVGFRDNVPGSQGFKIAVFAATQCSDLPFGGNNNSVGCPANTGNYVQLGETYVSGSNEWVNVVFEFTADQPYEVIVLGPSCSANPYYYLDPYFYVDRLTLAESTAFGTPFESVTGSICNNDLLLQIAEEAGHSYQWYQDGVAMIGETNPSLLLTALNNTEGTYLVVITTPDGCFLSREYDLRIPPYYDTATASICEMEFYLWGTDTLTQAGIYETLFEATDGCDSIAQLILEVRENSYAIVRDTFCAGEPYSFYDIATTEEGTYETSISNAAGCDSIIRLELTGIGTGTGVELPDFLLLDLGKTIDLAPDYYDPIFDLFYWYDNHGNILSNTLTVPMYQPTQTTTVYFQASNEVGCSDVDSLTVRVIPDYSLYIPNVFSPDDNGINDFFTCYAPISLEKIISFSVFDRWGNLVFFEDQISGAGPYKGWDGTFNGASAPQGVYAYMIRALFLNGTEKVFSGDVTLLR